MLLALRAGASPELPLIREAQYLRTAAVHRILDEREAETGKSVPKKVRNNARDVANSWAKFESWAGSHFTLLFEDDDLHESFKRYSHWIPVINRILNDPPDPSDEVFLRAVERSAKDSGGVPTVKAVRTAFNDSRPQNLEGSGSTFRTLKTKLGFDWLPSAPPPGRPKSVGKK